MQTETATTGVWARDLGALTDADLPVAGGKASGLAGLIRAGLPVPAGFVVLAGAYRNFVDANGLQEAIDSTLDAVEPPLGDETEHGDEAERAAAALAERFSAAPVPDTVAADIRAAYTALGRPKVAVRSSSLQEDMAGASFAGQYETLLNVGDEAALLEAVVRCWASAWGARVLAYRARQGLGGDVDHAVVVQRQVAAERAGVVFTADPMSGRRDRVRVSSAWGLGKAVVDGQVVPDEWLVDAAGCEVLQRHLGDKTVWTVPTATGTETVPASKEQRAIPSLTDAEAAELARLGLRAQAAFGSPQDVEWAAEDGRLLLVQSRPITTLFPLPQPEPDADEGLRIYVSYNRVTQGFVEPMTPMGNETWRLMFSGFAAMARGRQATLYPKVHRIAAHRMHLDATDFLTRPRVADRVLEVVSQKDPLAARALRHVLDRDAEMLHRARRRAAFPWRLLMLLPGLVARSVWATARPAAAGARMQRTADSQVERLRREAARLRGVEERLAWLERQRVTPMAVAVRQMSYLSVALPAAQKAEAQLAEHVGSADAFAAVHHSPPGNPTSEMGLDVLEAAKQVRDSSQEATPHHPAVTQFLARYGHRTVLEVDTGVPRWREDPARVVGWIAEAAADPDLDRRLAEERQAVDAADRRAQEILARVPGRLRRRRIGWHLRRARGLVGTRERPKFDEGRFVEIFRDVLLGAGAELAAADRLDDAADVMFLTFADVRGDADLRTIAAENRRSYTEERARTSIPRVMTSTGEAIYAIPGDDGDGADGLAGVAASPGLVEGRVRIVTEPTAGALEPGEILVTHSTDPAWTPVMLRAGGIIMETGGPYMHGAIIAREQGIPAVAGLEGITGRLSDGDRVRLDGEAGTVTVL